MEKLGFVHYFNYLDHAGMEEMLSAENGGRLLELARDISVCLHEDWKKNLIREKGKEYQHFRPVKDAEFASEVLQNSEKYLKQTSPDGKPLYRIIETEKDGKEVREVQFDLIRVPFENLTKKWQEANLEAAKFALCLVKTAADGGSLGVQGEELFKNFEKMSHDVHLEWMHREGDWAAPELLLPYEYLTVDTNGYNEKDKDRAHVLATTSELTFQPNILARNRSIVITAIKSLFADNAVQSGLNPEIMKNIVGIQDFITESNEKDYGRYLKIKKAVEERAERVIGKGKEISFDVLEQLAATYYEAWKEGSREIGELPKSVDVKYDSIVVDDLRVNHKNIARTEVKKILSEMVSEKRLDSSVKQQLDGMADPNTPLGKRIAAKNETDFADYLATIQSHPE